MSRAPDPAAPDRAVPHRVLMTVDAVGGVWRYAIDAAAVLRERGLFVVLAGLGPPPSPSLRAEAEALGPLFWLDQPLDWMARAEHELDGVAPALQRLADRERCDLLHLNQPTQAVGLEPGHPAVAVSHSCVSTWFRAVRNAEPPPEWRWQSRRNRDGLRAARLAAAPSHAHARLLAACYDGLPPVHVVPNAVHPLDPATERIPEVVAAARWWDDGKNADTLDRAAASISWPVLAAGATAGPDGQQVRFRHAAAPGPLPAAAVRARLSRAAIFVSPSRYEPFGLAALEAASGGCALVLADIPTYRELWRDAAVLVPANDPVALADAVNALAAEPARRTELALRARRRAAVFTRDRQADALLDCYRRAA